MPTPEDSHISAERLNEIADKALTYWFDYLDAEDYRRTRQRRTFSEEGIFLVAERESTGTANTYINTYVQSFFKFCAEQLFGTRQVNFIPHTLKGKKSAPSWLWHEHGHIPSLLIDFGQIH